MMSVSGSCLERATGLHEEVFDHRTEREDGKNVSAPTIKTTLRSRMVKSGPLVGKVPLEGGEVFLAARLPAIASTGTMIGEAPEEHVHRERVIIPMRIGV